MKYINKYETESAALATSGLLAPQLVYVRESTDVLYSGSIPKFDEVVIEREGNELVINPKPTVSYAGLKMTSTGNSTISFNRGATAYYAPDLKYSLDGGSTWTQWDFSAISLTDGQTVCFKGNNSCISYSDGQYNNFVMTGSIAASGNIMSILDDGACTRTSVTYACFVSLFRGCTSLTTAPELPATTLNQYCYHTMFYRCTSLTTAPELPATTLKNNCYQQMFRECSSLTTAPELPATTLTNSCYYWMFRDCNKLKYIKCLATNIGAQGCTYGWVSGISGIVTNGTFVKAASMTGWTEGTSGIPSGWTVQDAQ